MEKEGKIVKDAKGNIYSSLQEAHDKGVSWAYIYWSDQYGDHSKGVCLDPNCSCIGSVDYY